MNINPIVGLAASLAGQPLAERQSVDGDQSAESAAAQRALANQKKAEAAAGLGAMDAQDQQPHERDADGRQVLSWVIGDDHDAQPDGSDGRPPCSLDPDGDRGGAVDLLA